MYTKYCIYCHRVINYNTTVCPYCGGKQPNYTYQSQKNSHEHGFYTDKNGKIHLPSRWERKLSTTIKGYWENVIIFTLILIPIVTIIPMRGTTLSFSSAIYFGPLMSLLITQIVKDHYWTYTLHRACPTKINKFANTILYSIPVSLIVGMITLTYLLQITSNYDIPYDTQLCIVGSILVGLLLGFIPGYYICKYEHRPDVVERHEENNDE